MYILYSMLFLGSELYKNVSRTEDTKPVMLLTLYVLYDFRF